MQYHNTNSHHFTSDSEPTKNNYEKNNSCENSHISLELTSLMACINMAKIDFDLDHTEIELITSMIESSELNIDEKMSLLESLRTKELFKLDLSSFKNNELYSIALIENLVAVMNADDVIKPSEKIYFNKLISELGFSKEQVSDYF